MSKLLEIVLGDAWTETSKFISEKGYEKIYIFLVFIFVIISVIVFVLTWISVQSKVKSEIKKNNVEFKEKHLNLIDRITAKRDKYIKTSELLECSISDVIESVNNRDEVQLQERWEQTRSIFYNYYLPDFYSFLESKQIIFDIKSKDILYYIDDELFRFLETVDNFLNTMNCDDLRKFLTTSKIIISKETVNPVLRLINDNVPFYDIKRRKKYNKYLKKFDRATV